MDREGITFGDYDRLEGLEGEPPASIQKDFGTHMAFRGREGMMVVDNDNQTLEKMQQLLAATRGQLAEAVREANELHVDSSDEETGGGKRPPKALKFDELDEEELAKLSARERNLALRRAKNREAARRSRQRKMERINRLNRDIKALQEENLVLLKCIEEFTQKVVSSKLEQNAMRTQLAHINDTTTTSIDQQYQMMDVDNVIIANNTQITGPPPLPSQTTARIGPDIPNLPSLADLQQRMQREGGLEPSQLTARSGTLSARGTAVAEHMAMLSKENSPRDDENINTTTTTTTTTIPGVMIAVQPQHVDINQFFNGSWDGGDAFLSDKKEKQ